SRLVSRSSSSPLSSLRLPNPAVRPALPAEWQSGHAAACKAVYAGSIPTSASNKPALARLSSRSAGIPTGYPSTRTLRASHALEQLGFVPDLIVCRACDLGAG